MSIRFVSVNRNTPLLFPADLREWPPENHLVHFIIEAVERPNISRNGIKSNRKQNYRCKDCGRQFISGHELTYRGCLLGIVNLVKIMLVRGIGIRDISTVLRILSVFRDDPHEVGKYTVGIEGNNCRMRHRIWRVFRRTCFFSKKFINH